MCWQCSEARALRGRCNSEPAVTVRDPVASAAGGPGGTPGPTVKVRMGGSARAPSRRAAGRAPGGAQRSAIAVRGRPTAGRRAGRPRPLARHRPARSS